jgi:hypothetical protein
MFIYAALFTIAKLQNKPRYPSTDEWIKKTRNIYTVEFYSVIRKSEITSFSGRWIEPEIIMSSEIKQTEQDKHCMFSLCIYSSVLRDQGKSIEHNHTESLHNTLCDLKRGASSL